MKNCPPARVLNMAVLEEPEVVKETTSSGRIATTVYSKLLFRPGKFTVCPFGSVRAKRKLWYRKLNC